MTIDPRLQHQYVEGQGRPGFPELLAAFQRESDAAAAAPGAVLDQPYGPHPRQRLDAFPATAVARGVLLYLHAGYWQSRDKALFRWLAPAFQQRGFHMVFANYPLCPEVTLPALVQALAPAVAAARALVPQGAALPLAVAGHSAGAHLASLAGLDQPGRVDGVWAISGIYDLGPLLHTTLNERLRLDASTAQACSPLPRAGTATVPAAWLVGADETPDFLAQNRAMHAAWQTGGAFSCCIEQPGTDHFTVLRAWAAGEAGLEARFEAWWREVAARRAARS